MELPTRQEIEDADVIFGVDITTGAETIFYGQSLLMLIASGYENPKGTVCTVLRVDVDFSDESMEPELLALTVKEVKGGCDYLDEIEE